MDVQRYVLCPDGKRRPTPSYSLWTRMLRRCNNPNHSTYRFYGGRGIYVCERWRDFALFMEDMGPRPDPKAELDRIDTNGPYAPDNCRWVTHQENTNNTRRNVWLEWQGRQQTISQWARELDMDTDVLNARIRKGWTVERTLTTPAKPNVYLEYEGKRMTLADWSRETGITRCTLTQRMKRGETAAQILRPPEFFPPLSVEWNGKRQGLAAWSREVGLPAEVIRTRIQLLGWSVERALTTPVRTWPSRPTTAAPVPEAPALELDLPTLP